MFMIRNSAIFEFGAVQKCANIVDIREMLQDEYLDAKLGVDTDENETSKVHTR